MVAVLAFLVLMGMVGIAGHIVREHRKGHRAALVYGPLAMAIVAALAGLWAYALMRNY
jgi:hypothetical protein